MKHPSCPCCGRLLLTCEACGLICDGEWRVCPVCVVPLTFPRPKTPFLPASPQEALPLKGTPPLPSECSPRPFGKVSSSPRSRSRPHARPPAGESSSSPKRGRPRGRPKTRLGFFLSRLEHQSLQREGQRNDLTVSDLVDLLINERIEAFEKGHRLVSSPMDRSFFRLQVSVHPQTGEHLSSVALSRGVTKSTMIRGILFSFEEHSSTQDCGEERDGLL